MSEGTVAGKKSKWTANSTNGKHECSSVHHHRHRRRRQQQHNQGLGLKTCSFKAQCVPGLSIFVSVFPHPILPEVGTGKPALVGSFYPFIPGALTTSFDTILSPLLCCLLLIHYVHQGFSGGPVCKS
jgi:hypothetical protein